MYNPPISSRAQSVSSIRSAVKACTQLDILRQDVHEFALALRSEGMSCQLLHGDVKKVDGISLRLQSRSPRHPTLLCSNMSS